MTTSIPAGVPGKVAVYVMTPVRRVVADGRGFPVTVIVVNGLGHAIPQGPCGGPAAGLTRPGMPFEPAYPAVGCVHAPVFAPGVTRLSRTVSTAYMVCLQHGSSTRTLPRCTGRADNAMPPLPPGTYRVVLDVGAIPHVVEPRPVSVVLTRR